MTTPQQPEPSATPLTDEYVENGYVWETDNKRTSFHGDQAFMRWLEEKLTAAETELRATRAMLASERAAGADWKNIATQAADKLHAMVLERDRLNAALQDIEQNCSLNGFPEDAPEQVAFIAGLAKEALGAPTSAWQPIETAPKDGTRVLLYFVPNEVKMPQHETVAAGLWKRFQWRDGNGDVKGEPFFMWQTDGGLGPMSFKATHWMPLPALPLAAPTQAGKVGP